MTKKDRDFRVAVVVEVGGDKEVFFAFMPKTGYLRPGDEVEVARFLDDVHTIRARVLMADDYVSMDDIEGMATATKVTAMRVIKHYDVETVDWTGSKEEDLEDGEAV